MTRDDESDRYFRRAEAARRRRVYLALLSVVLACLAVGLALAGY